MHNPFCTLKGKNVVITSPASSIAIIATAWIISEIPLIILILEGNILYFPPRVNSPNGYPKVTSSVNSAIHPKMMAPIIEKESITKPP